MIIYLNCIATYYKNQNNNIPCLEKKNLMQFLILDIFALENIIITYPSILVKLWNSISPEALTLHFSVFVLLVSTSCH